jgi:hypothetical protein
LDLLGIREIAAMSPWTAALPEDASVYWCHWSPASEAITAPSEVVHETCWLVEAGGTVAPRFLVGRIRVKGDRRSPNPPEQDR